MQSIERALADALARGEEPSLADLGGAAALAGNEAVLASCPLMPELLRIALEALQRSGSQQEVIERFVVACPASTTDPFSMQEAVGLIAGSTMTETVREACFAGFLDRVSDTAIAPGVRWWALDGALRLALEKSKRKHKLLVVLLDVSPDDDPEFLRHAAKILGIAHSLWREEELVTVLRPLADLQASRDEAAFELGMVSLADALDARHRAEAARHFEDARDWFRASQAAREDRQDAAVYAVALDTLLSFEGNETPERLLPLVVELARAAAMHQAWNQDQDEASWLGARWTEMAHWHSLAAQLVPLANHLAEPSWLDAAAVLEGTLFSTYVASRTVLQRRADGGIETMVRPRIEAAFLRERGLLHVLDRWLAQEEADSDWGPVAAELLERVRHQTAHGGPGNGARAADTTS
ncbi:hypothetical protein ACHMW5_34335 [Azospirillum melinis]|uniref:hypothetical protein n=1 Tax=Azospirillum melinis TaxID=328839 RepID=UPI0037563DA2